MTAIRTIEAVFIVAGLVFGIGFSLVFIGGLAVYCAEKLLTRILGETW